MLYCEKTMLVRVFCCLFFYVIAQMSADVVQNIPLSFYNERENKENYLKCYASELYILLEDQPAEVIVNYSKAINSGECCYQKNEYQSYLDSKFNVGGPLHKASFHVEKRKHSNGWKCIFLTNRSVKKIQPIVQNNGVDYTQVTCTFRVHVRQTKSPITIKVNDISLNTTRTDLSVTEYDAVGYYDYEDGESIQLVCEKDLNEGLGTLKYIFYRNKDESVLTTDHEYKNNISIQATLKSEYNNGYWECVYTKIFNGDKDSNVLRIYLRLQANKNNLLRVQVNGEPQIPTTIGGKCESLYKYRSNAELTVVCEKNTNVDGCLELRYNNECANRRKIISNECNESKTVATLTELEQCDPNFALICVLKSNGMDVKTYTINFKYADIHNVIIEGLKNTMVIVESDSNYNLIHVINYQFKDGDTLHLKCSTKREYELGARCNFSLDGVLSPDAIMNQSVISTTFVLDKNNNNTIIKCECVNKDEQTAIGETHIHLLLYEDRKVLNDEFWQWVRMVGSVVVSLIIVVIIICAITHRIRKTRMADEPTDITYENLPHHNEGRAAPFPEQWNDELRAASTVHEAPGYSVPYNQDDDNVLYATPVPKNAKNMEPLYAQLAFEIVKSRKDKEYANADTFYAEIGNNNENLAPKAEEANYAQVLPKAERNKAVYNNGEYSNVFKNERYVNADTPEYAEPAYCTMDIKSTSKKHK